MGVSIGNGMTISISSWGGSYSDLSWLDGDTGCSGDCTNSPTVKFSNIVIGGSAPSTKYACSGGSCTESSTGNYNSLSNCQSACSQSGGWSCSDGGCTNTGS